MAVRPFIAVITGANRGIGHSMCEAVLRGTAWNRGRPITPVVLFATSRSGEIPRAGTQQQPLENFRLVPVQLSLTDGRSIEALVSKIKTEYGGCDVLINNAGVYHYRKDITAAERDEMLNTNYFGTVQMCQSFIPIMRSGGRIVNVSSQSGQLRYFSNDLRQSFLKEDLSLPQLAETVQKYRDLVNRGVATDHGWPPMTYFTSKAALNAATRVLARDNQHLLINCCCPGWVNTELGGQAGQAPKTPDQGARIPLRLGFGDIQNVSGHYWANASVASTGDGEVRPW